MSDTARKRRHPEPTPTVRAETDISRGLTMFGTVSQQLTLGTYGYLGNLIGCFLESFHHVKRGYSY